jgi:hypothetical protein
MSMKRRRNARRRAQELREAAAAVEMVEAAAEAAIAEQNLQVVNRSDDVMPKKNASSSSSGESIVWHPTLGYTPEWTAKAYDKAKINGMIYPDAAPDPARWAGEVHDRDMGLDAPLDKSKELRNGGEDCQDCGGDDAGGLPGADPLDPAATGMGLPAMASGVHPRMGRGSAMLDEPCAEEGEPGRGDGGKLAIAKAIAHRDADAEEGEGEGEAKAADAQLATLIALVRRMGERVPRMIDEIASLRGLVKDLRAQNHQLIEILARRSPEALNDLEDPAPGSLSGSLESPDLEDPLLN